MSIARWRTAVAIVLVFTLLGATAGLTAAGSVFDARPTVAQEEPSGAEMLIDIVVVRPVSFVGLVVGCLGWLVAAPLALIADGSEGLNAVSGKLVVAPAMYTFNRTVGDL